MKTLIHFKRFILSFISILIGMMIVFFSLFRVSAARAISASANSSSSELTMYLDQPIRPDHVLYPVVAAKNRLECSILEPAEKIERQLQLANDRLSDAEVLAQFPEKREIALSTLTKAEQYIFDATVQLNQINDPALQKKSQIQATLRNHLQRIQDLESNFSPEQCQGINDIKAKQQALLVSLSE